VPARPLVDSIVILAKGLCMGAADVVPGVSGGTMALILGIYPRLLRAIRAFDLELASALARGRIAAAARHVDLALLAPLGLGIVAALMFLTRVVSLPELIRTRPEPVYALFFGLIAASIVVLLRGAGPLAPRTVALYALGAAAGFGIVNLVPFETPEAPWFIAASGALAITALILPGISGAFVLLILHKYAYVLDAIGRLDVAVLAPFGLGAAIGLALSSRLLVWLLERWYRATLAAITGLLTGSLWVIWPFQARTYVEVRGEPRLIASEPVWPAELAGPELAAFGLMALGLAVVFLLERLARGRGAAA